MAATSDSEPNELTPTVLPLSEPALTPLVPKKRKRVGARGDQAVVAALRVRIDGCGEAHGHRLKAPLPHQREATAAAFGVHNLDIESAHAEEAGIARHPEREHVHRGRGDADAEGFLSVCGT